MLQETRERSIDIQELSDTLFSMKNQEDKTYNNVDYFKKFNQCNALSNDTNIVDEVCREKMATWFIEVGEFCNYSRNIVEISMAYLDRYLGSEDGAYVLYSKRDYQLTAMTCLLLAVKIHQQVKLNIKLLAELSQGVYSALEFKVKEREILEILNWRVCTPTSSCFACYYLDLLPKNLPFALKEQIKFLSNFQIENSIKDYFFASKKPSLIALSSILNAINVVECSNTLLHKSFHRDIILIAGIPADINILDIQNRMRNYMKCFIPSVGKSACRNYDVEPNSYIVQMSSTCISSRQA